LPNSDDGAPFKIGDLVHPLDRDAPNVPWRVDFVARPEGSENWIISVSDANGCWSAEYADTLELVRRADATSETPAASSGAAGRAGAREAQGTTGVCSEDDLVILGSGCGYSLPNTCTEECSPGQCKFREAVAAERARVTELTEALEERRKAGEFIRAWFRRSDNGDPAGGHFFWPDSHAASYEDRYIGMPLKKRFADLMALLTGGAQGERP
jgi:hypothetical protein